LIQKEFPFARPAMEIRRKASNPADFETRRGPADAFPAARDTPGAGYP
jgi:hypothetical protein